MEVTELTITAVGSEGQGIGNLPSGKTCFVPGVFPGEVCTVQIESETSKYAVAGVIELIKASPDRIRSTDLRGSNDRHGQLCCNRFGACRHYCRHGLDRIPECGEGGLRCREGG